MVIRRPLGIIRKNLVDMHISEKGGNGVVQHGNIHCPEQQVDHQSCEKNQGYVFFYFHTTEVGLGFRVQGSGFRV